MTDLATLGLAVDSSQVKSATTALDGLTKAGASAEVQANSLATASSKVTTSLSTQYSALLQQATLAQRGQQAVTNGIMGMIGPAALVGGAVGLATTAAGLLFEAILNGGPKVELILAEQARLIGLSKAAFKDATDAAGKFYDTSKAILLLQTQQTMLDLQKNIVNSTAELVRSFKGSSFDVLGNATGFDQFDISKKFEPFRGAITALNDSINAGAPAIEAYREAIANIGNANPALATTANELLKISQAAADAAKIIRDTEASLRLLRGQGTAEDRERLGLSNKTPKVAVRDPFEGATNAANRHIAAMIADARAVGDNVGEHARLRTEAALLEAAQQNGKRATDAQVQKLKELGQAAADAAMALERARVQNDIGFGRNTALLTQEDVQIAQQLRGLYGDNIPAALASTEASAMRVNDAMRSVSGQISGGLTTALSDISLGTASASDAFRSFGMVAARAIEEMIIKLAIVGPLMRSLQSGLGGGDILVGAASLGLPHFASGTDYAPGGMAVVGEKGPEIINLPRGSGVVPNNKIGGGDTYIENHYHQDFRGVDPSMRAFLVSQIRASQKQTLAAVPGITAKANSNNPNLLRS